MTKSDIFRGGSEREILDWIIRQIDWAQMQALDRTPVSKLSSACPMCGLPQSPDTVEPPTYTICPLCNWEDDGDHDAQEYSGANHHIHQTRARSEVIVRTVRALALERYPDLKFRDSVIPLD